MIDKFLEKLNKIDLSPIHYSAALEDVYVESLKLKENEVFYELTKLFEINTSNNNIIFIFDIFLKLKSENYFSKVNVERFNIMIKNHFKLISDENIKKYLIGYILQNDLLTDEIRNDAHVSNIVNNRLSEKDLTNDILKVIIDKRLMAPLAINAWITGLDNRINVFKIGELVREKIYTNQLKLDIFNEVISELIDLVQDKYVNVVSFILAIYQDVELIAYQNVRKLNEVMYKVEDKFLNNLFCDIASNIGFNRVLNTYEERLDQMRLFKNLNLIGAAARAQELTLNDYELLDKYLNRTIKSRNKVEKINLKKSYNANDILHYAQYKTGKVDLDKILRVLNIQLYEDYFDGDMWGFSFKLKDQYKASIILNKRNRFSENRRRFTIAHEIGHICMSKAEEIHSNDNIYNMNIHKRNESLGNEFAGELLIPSSELNEILNKDINLRTVEYVSEYFEVSYEAAGNRLILATDGNYRFVVHENNKFKYVRNPKERYDMGDGIADEINDFIKSSNSDILDRFIKDINCKISIKVEGNYKYTILNYVYAY